MVADRQLPAAAAATLLGHIEARPVGAARVGPEAIAIIGMAGRFGAAPDLDAYWRLIRDGADCLVPAPARWPGAPAATRGGFLPDAASFDPLFFRISPTEAALMDPQQRVFLEQAYLAFQDAGLPEEVLSGARCGVYVGAGAGDYAHRFDNTEHATNPLGLMGNVASILSARIAYALNLKGPSIALDTACSSSLVAVHLACEALRSGSVDMALAGGVAVISTPRFIEAMAGTGAISTGGACRAFDAAADGFVCGEGAGAVVLKRLSEALRDGDVIHGVIAGSGINQDGRTNGLTAPSAPAQAALQTDVYRAAGIDPGEIGYVEAHGTGTILGDPIEVEGLTQAFRGWTQGRGFCALGSVKANIGHTLTAAGIAGLLKLLLMRRHGVIPPQPHYAVPNPRLGLDETPFHVSRAVAVWPVDRPRAAISSFGFSGTNAHLVLDPAPGGALREPVLRRERHFVLSARTERALRREAGAMAAYLTAEPGLRPDDVAHTLAHGRSRHAVQAGFDATELGELAVLLAAYAEGGRGTGDVVPGGPIEPLARRVTLPGCPFDRAAYGLPDGPGALLPDLVRAVEAVQARADPALVDQGAGFVAVEAWGRRALAAAYGRMGLFTGRAVHTRAGLRRALGIVAGRAALHDALMDILARDGVVRLEADLVRVVGAAPEAGALGAERVALVQALPALEAFLPLLERCTGELPGLLVGGITAPEVLFPGGSLALVESVYAANELADHFNGLMAAAVVAAGRRHSGRISILEIGAGTGGATVAIVAALADAGLAERVEYRMTDVSASFLPAARARFAEYKFLSFGVLDVAAGAAEPADILVASNVLHATPDIGRTLVNVHALVRPGGTLVLNEVTAVQDFATLTFGLTDGWWAFTDRVRLPNSPLLDVAAWRAALARAGFPEAAACGLPGEADDARHGQAVIMAQRDGAAVAARMQAALVEAGPVPAVPVGGIEGLVLAAVAGALTLPVAEVDRNGRFSDYGIDSILGIRLVETLNGRLGLDLRPTILFDHPTVATLSRHLATLRPVPAVVDAVAVRPLPGGVTDRRVAVIGLAGRFGDTADLEDVRRMLAEGRSGLSAVPASRWVPGDPALPAGVAAEDAFLRTGGFLRDADRFDPLFFRISGAEAELTDPQHRVFLTEAWRALEDAGYGEQALDNTRCGVFVGAYGGDYTHRMAQLGIVPEAFAFMGNAASILAGRIAYILNLKGPCLAIDTACSSSLVAVHLACGSLLSGECDMALAGGVFLTTTPGFNTAAAKAGMLSPRGQCRTFDAGADGFVPGEGAGVVVLKRYAEAVADGDHIDAVILGTAVNQDGRTNGITAPSPEAQAAVIAEAMDRAGVHPDAVGLIEAHGTGTRLGDPIEMEGLTRAFRRGMQAGGTQRRGYCAIGSIKTNIGHAAHAAGVAGLLKLILSIRDGQLFPSLNFSSENPILRLAETPFVVNTALRPWVGTRIGGVSSFGFSGTNAHLVLGAGPEPAAREAGSGAVLIPLSAKTPGALQGRIALLAGWLASHPDAELRDVSRTLAAGRSHFGCRWCAVVGSVADLHAALGEAPPAIRVADAHLERVARDFCEGAEIDLRWIAADGRRVSLPSYPFEEQSYWIGNPSDAVVGAPKAAVAPLPAFSPALVPVTFLTARWIGAASDSAGFAGEVWLIGGDAAPFLAAGLRASVVTLGALPSLPPAAVVLLHDGEDVLPAVVAILRAVDVGLVLVVGPQGDAARPLGRSLAFAGGRVAVRVVDPGGATGAALAGIVATELAAPAADQVRWAGSVRQVRRMVITPAPAAPAQDWRGTILITGGGGVLGQRFAREAVRRGGRAALIGRGPETDGLRSLLGELGGRVRYDRADVTDERALRRVIAAAEAQMGPVRGVIHAAGVAAHRVFAESGWDEFARVLAPKQGGALALDAALGGAELDFFVLFGSLAAELGDFGQAAYAAANAALAGFAVEREAARAAGKRHGTTVAIEWPLWREGRGVLSAEGERLFLQSSGMPYLETEQGLRAFDAALTLGAAAVAVVPGGRAVAEHFFPAPEARPMRAPAILQDEITGLVADLLKLDRGRLEPHTGFAEFGFDSIALKSFANALSSRFGIAVTPAVFFAHGTIAALAAHLAAEYPGAVPVVRVEAAAVATAVSAPLVPVQPASDDAVAIIGMAGRFPGAPDLDSFWRNLESGFDAIRAMPRERGASRDVRAGFLDDVAGFDAGFFRIPQREAMLMDPQHRLALETVWQCVENAALCMDALAGRSVGVFFGQQVNEYAALLPSRDEGRAQATLGNIAAMLPNRISFQFDFRGPSEAIDTACSSALVAVHRAAVAVARGECEMAVAGGVSLILSEENLVSTQRLGILSPDGVCRAFDAGANGYVKGEGVGAVLLKPLSRALADGDPIHAVIRGSATNHGGRAHSLTAPNAGAQADVIVAALTAAGLGSDTIGYVEAHGTGTELGDPVEVMALKAAFARAASGTVAQPRTRLGTLKPAIGHLEPASGIAGLLKVVLALQQRMLPATLHFSRLNPHIQLQDTPFAIAERLAPWSALRDGTGTALPRRAGVSSFGFGGSNAHVVVEEAPVRAEAVASAAPVLLLLSAPDRERLAALVAAVAVDVRARPGLDVAGIAATLMVGRRAMRSRLAFIHRPGDHLPARLAEAACAMDGAGVAETWVGDAGAVRADAEAAAAHAELFRNERLGALAALWVQGEAIDWRSLLGRVAGRISLPGMRFAPTRCWFDAPVPAAAVHGLAVLVAPGPVLALEPAAALPAPVIAASRAVEETIRERLLRMVADALYLDPGAIDAAASFGDLGLDSILAVELTREVNIAFGTCLQAARLYDHASIDALAAHLSGAERVFVAPSEPAFVEIAPAADEAIVDQLRAMLAGALFMDAAAIDPHAGFMDLGLDSILAVEFTKSINDAFGAGLKAARLYDHPDLASLAAFLDAQRGQPASAPTEGVVSVLVARVAAATGRAVLLDTPLADISLEPAQAVALLDALNAEFGCAVSPDEVGRCRDLQAVAALVRPRGSSAPAAVPVLAQPNVVPMGGGSSGVGLAAFWVHGATGDVGWVVKFARSLDPGLRSFGLEAPGLDGRTAPLASIQALAAAHAAAIVRTHPAGPVTIGGYSAGGAIAFEVVRLLLQQGRVVRRLVLIDAPAPGNPAVPMMQAAYGEGYVYLVAANWMARLWDAPAVTAPMLAGLSKAAMLDRVVAHLEPSAPSPVAAAGLRDGLVALDAVGWAIGAALCSHRPDPLPMPVDTLFVACRHGMRGPENPFGLPECLEAETYREGWDALLTGSVQTLELECDHFRAVSDPFAGQIAAALGNPDALAAE